MDLFKLPNIQAANEQALATGVILNTGLQKHTITDSPNSTIHTTTGKYSLEAKDNLTVNVYETSSWIMPTLIAYILGKPALLALLKQLIAWRKRKQHDR